MKNADGTQVRTADHYIWAAVSRLDPELLAMVGRGAIDEVGFPQAVRDEALRIQAIIEKEQAVLAATVPDYPTNSELSLVDFDRLSSPMAVRCRADTSCEGGPPSSFEVCRSISTPRRRGSQSIPAFSLTSRIRAARRSEDIDVDPWNPTLRITEQQEEVPDQRRQPLACWKHSRHQRRAFVFAESCLGGMRNERDERVTTLTQRRSHANFLIAAQLLREI
jgi:hypothetical protein